MREHGWIVDDRGLESELLEVGASELRRLVAGRCAAHTRSERHEIAHKLLQSALGHGSRECLLRWMLLRLSRSGNRANDEGENNSGRTGARKKSHALILSRRPEPV